MLEKFNLTGKYALITGAAGLLGFQHAFALSEVGSSLILTDIDEEKLIKVKDRLTPYLNKNQKIYINIMDVSNEESIKSIRDLYIKKNIRIDILINNAAIDPKVTNSSSIQGSRLEYFDLLQWNKEISVGLTGAFLCSKVFGFQMTQDLKGGVILNIASDLSVLAPNQSIYKINGKHPQEQPVKPVTYSVIKAGLVGLTKYLATYWPDKNIRCNALSPGGIFNNQNQDFLNKVQELIPLNRMAHVDEYNSAIQFLCSDASSYMNGQNIIIDGGRSVW
jgi:NAD(P)-dependent dehydrogenase (short-subunit alcohol dehydrogenase family)